MPDPAALDQLAEQIRSLLDRVEAIEARLDRPGESHAMPDKTTTEPLNDEQQAAYIDAVVLYELACHGDDEWTAGPDWETALATIHDTGRRHTDYVLVALAEVASRINDHKYEGRHCLLNREDYHGDEVAATRWGAARTTGP